MSEHQRLLLKIFQGTSDANIAFDDLCNLLRRLGYEIILYWSGEDNAFVADVPELPGCIAHGDSHENALANAKKAIQLWIDSAREFGREVPEPKGRRLMLA